MKIHVLLAAAAAGSLAALPAIALADLHVNAIGFHRVVTETNQSPACHVHRVDDGTMVRCADGSKGTMTLYRRSSETPVCELDFWPQSNNAAQRWRVQVSHQDSTYGTCTTQWQGADTLNVTLAGGT
ncbi:MAG TPA: hypothetical protein VGZ02_05050 [Candidatus Baltobacteraceae bacterium]|jgi:hypothetical protein|nr:hypothetical protein [Candidatus Baltobacteraceae bacterium]